VDVEVVAFGPGLRLLFAENSNAERIDWLAENSGARFSACDNTTSEVIQILGHAPQFNSHAGHVDAGVVRILELVGQGYLLIKP
jgi:intracellular sulfur oxidation DsrE/DsrF family protein